MTRLPFILLAIVAVCSIAPAHCAITCPEMPSAVTTVNKDIKSDITASVGSIGKLKTGEVALKTEITARNLFEKYPNVDKLLTLQTMSSTYCSILNSVNISDLDKLQRWEAFQSMVLKLDPAKAGTVKKVPVVKSRITDVLVEKIDSRSAIIDFRVINEGSTDLQISRIHLVPVERDRVCAAAPADYSKVYDFNDIGGLSPTYGTPREIPVSQVISAGKSDRFGVKVGETHPSCFKNYWKIKAYLITSIGKIGGQEIEIDLR
jgi:hypothetical protein